MPRNHRESTVKLRTGKETVLAISDLQAPYQHQDALRFLEAVADEYTPTKIVCIGDSLDMHTLGKWAHHPDLPGPKDEYEQGIAFMKNDLRVIMGELSAGKRNASIRLIVDLMSRLTGSQSDGFSEHE